jgi:hypothetical protein
MATRMQQRRGTAQQWTDANPRLAAGEIGLETDTNKFKIGDDVNLWDDLAYFVNSDGLAGELDGFATEDYVDGAIAAIPLPDLTGYATEGYVDTAIENVVGLAPEDLNTLSELADALGDNPDAITTLQSDVAALQASGGGDLSLKADKLDPEFSITDEASGFVRRTVTFSENQTTLSFSSDGVSWETLPSFPEGDWSDTLVYGGDKFVSLSTSGKSTYSLDGRTWITQDRPGPASSSWRVAYGNGTFVAVAAFTTTALYSTDGITWNTTILPSNSYWRSVAYGNGIFVAAISGSTSAAWSTDGISWNSYSLPLSTNDNLQYVNGKFIALRNYTNTGMYSTDGITWSTMSIPVGAWYQSIVYGNNKFVAVSGAYGFGMYSSNGISWTTFGLPNNASWVFLAYENNKFVASAFFQSSVLVSDNGTDWTLTPVEYSDISLVISGTTLAEKTISALELLSLDGISSNIQNELESKADLSALESKADLSALESVQDELESKADTNSPTFTGLTDFEGIVDFSEAVVIGIDSLPNQDNNSGKYLTTNGNVASWQVIPVQTPHPFSMIG